VSRPAIRIIFKPLLRENARGLSVPADRTLWIDPRTPWPAHTLLHELVHIEQPGWSESKVIRETRKRWKASTWRQKAEWLKLLGHAKIGDDDE
jgi:hypothetical protein